MRREFLVERQGKQFILYAGLLALGHEQGLKSIRTHLIQIPTESNQRMAIVSATVVLEKDGVEREFNGIGDASPNNVASAMANCLLRLAETRAKARALRDAVNVGVAALEELGDDDVYEGAPERGYAVAPRGAGRSGPARLVAATRAVPAGGIAANGGGRSSGRDRTVSVVDHEATVLVSSVAESEARGASARGVRESGLGSPVTDAQQDAIRSLCRRRNLDGERAAKERFGVETLAALTQAQASDLIKMLQIDSATNRSAPAAA